MQIVFILLSEHEWFWWKKKTDCTIAYNQQVLYNAKADNNKATIQKIYDGESCMRSLGKNEGTWKKAPFKKRWFKDLIEV